MKRSERRLLTILLTLLILGGLLIGVDTYLDKKNELSEERSILELEWAEIEALNEQKDVWEVRDHWLKQTQPAFTSNKVISESIFDDSMAENRRGIAITKQTLLSVEPVESFRQAGVLVTATGELAAISRWLYDITRPTSFRTVRNITMKPNPESPENITTQFELLRFYAAPSS